MTISNLIIAFVFFIITVCVISMFCVAQAWNWNRKYNRKKNNYDTICKRYKNKPKGLKI